MTALLVIALIVLFVAIDGVRLYLKRNVNVKQALQSFKPFRNLETPLGIFFDHSHTWARLNDSGEFRVGLDELILQAVKDFSKLDLAVTGTSVQKGQKIGTLTAKGQKYDILSPISGTVISQNDGAVKDPSSLYEDPYFGGWLVKMWPTEARESIKSLLLGESAKRWMDREVQRFTDFLAQRATPALGEALADGAKPVMGAVNFLDERGRRDFEEEFLKKSDY
jgi:glycine cleavage system H lipoate-binding protein